MSQHPNQIRIHWYSTLVPPCGHFHSPIISILTSNHSRFVWSVLELRANEVTQEELSSDLTPQWGTHPCVAYSLKICPRGVVYSLCLYGSGEGVQFGAILNSSCRSLGTIQVCDCGACAQEGIAVSQGMWIFRFRRFCPTCAGSWYHVLSRCLQTHLVRFSAQS